MSNDSDIKLGSVEMGHHDRDWYVVATKLMGRSIRANTSSVLCNYVRRNKDKHTEMLRYTARKFGLTPDECFRRLLNDESLGEAVADFSESPPLLEDDQG